MATLSTKVRVLLLAGLTAGATGLLAEDHDPVPIAGGDVIPPLIHQFLPGPTSLGFEGIDVEPNGITNFRGFVASSYFSGTATDKNGAPLNLGADIRVYQGEYIAEDGVHTRGTFVEI